MIQRIPPNLNSMSPEDQRVVTESIYRMQTRRSHGHRWNSPLLRSSKKVKEVYHD